MGQFVLYSAKQGYKLAVYDISITNHDGARQAGNTKFFALTASNGATYPAVLNTLSPGVIGQGAILQGHIVFEIPLNSTATELTYNDSVDQLITNL